MWTLLISIAVTAVLALLFHAWLRDHEDRKIEALHCWADITGWRVRDAPRETPDGGKPMLSLEGGRDGYPLVLQWTVGDEWVTTVCHATLRRDHPASTLRRRPFARRLPIQERYADSEGLPPATRDVLGATSADSWHLSGWDLTATRQDWLGPKQIDAFIGEVVAVSAALDGPESDKTSLRAT